MNLFFRTFLVVAVTLTATSAQAENKCETVFAHGTSTESALSSEESRVLMALFSKAELNRASFSRFYKNIEILGRHVLLENLDAIVEKNRKMRHRYPPPLAELLESQKIKSGLQDGSITFKIETAGSHFFAGSHLHEIQFALEAKGQHLTSLKIRTNGEVAILAQSFLFRNERAPLRHKGVVILEDGNIMTFDFGTLALKSFDSETVLSRSMGELEKEAWIRGDLASLGSKNYNKKIHFALNYYYFKSEPSLVTLPKELLMSLYEKNLLEINSYTVQENNPEGMTSKARTHFGVEVELVFFKEAIFEMIPYIRGALRQEP